MSPDADQPVTDLFRVLMHPRRLAILDLLRDGEQCVCHMEAYLGKRQAYISQQLMLLREAGLVQDRRDGWNNYYRVVKPEIFALIDNARSLAGGPTPASNVRPPRTACPCPRCNPVLDVVELVVT